METVVGTKQGITEKANGWFSIEILRPGQQYPLKLDTKKQELVELARAAGDNVMEWQYNEVDSGTPNPHRPGSNFVNRYFEGVAPVGTTPQTQPDATAASNASSSAAAGTSGLSKEEWAAKDSAAHKRACIAIAVSALGEVGDMDLNVYLERVWHLATAFHANVIATRDDPTGEGVPF